MRRAFWSLAVFSMLLTPLAARPQAQAGEPEVGVMVLRLNEAPVAGRLVALDEAAVVVATAEAAQPLRLALGEVREVRWVQPPAVRANADRWRVTLLGGERVLGELQGAGEEGIRLRIQGAGDPAVISFEQMLTLERLAPDASLASQAQDLHPRTESGDVIYDARGDEVRGIVAGGGPEGLRIQGERGGERTVPWDALRVVHLENDARPVKDEQRVEIETADGSRWLASASAHLDGGAIVFTSLALPKLTLRVPVAQMQALRRQDARFLYATQLAFRSTFKPFYEDPPEIARPEDLTRLYGARVDRRPQGTPLRIGGIAYRHGFGVQSGSTIELPLSGAFARFEAWFGIDDEVLELGEDRRHKGNVDARIEADGKVLWEAKGVVGGTPPRRIGPLDVRGVQQLVLIVDYGQEDWILDRADWVDPVLVRP